MSSDNSVCMAFKRYGVTEFTRRTAISIQFQS